MYDFKYYEHSEEKQKYCEECGKDLTAVVDGLEILVKYRCCPRCETLLNKF